MDFDFDIFVIGAGSGGVRLSRVAAQLGARVAVAEDLFMGGTCVNVGCVPKKLFVIGAEFSEAFRAAEGYGWDVTEKQFHWSRLRDNKTREIERLNGIYRTIVNNSGATLLDGRASLVDPHTVELKQVADNGKVERKRFTAKSIVIATGGWPKRPAFHGAEHVITSNEVFSLEHLPERVLIQGGGYIAVEFAGIFHGLGCDVELVYRGDLFLRGFDTELRVFLAEQMRAKGIRITCGTDIKAIDRRGDSAPLQVALTDGSSRSVDAVLSAIGRNPKTQNLGLENTAVRCRTNGAICVDEHFRSDEPSIYAIGDAVGRMELTPVALAEGMALAHYLVNGKPIAMDYGTIPTAIFSQPPVATVGLSEDEAKQQGSVDVYASEFKSLKHTLTGMERRTLIKMIVSRDSQRVLGVHMVGEDAPEIMQGMAVAVKMGAIKDDFDATVGIHPSAAEEFVTLRTAREV